MLKNNNKRTITILIGILVAIAVIISSFVPLVAEITYDNERSSFYDIQWTEFDYKKITKILSPINF